jgi:hypothetical protein
MKTIQQILLIAVMVIQTVSCAKKGADIDPYIGTWNISMQTTTFDEQGNIISDVTENGSQITISKDADNLNGHPVKVSSTFSSFKPVALVLSLGNGGVFFSPDIHNNRINFWYYGWTSAVSETATIISRSANKLVLGAATPFFGSSTTTNTNTMQMMQTLTLSK